MARASTNLLYTYDPDAAWRHEITIEAVGPAAETVRSPCCVAGAVRPRTAVVPPVTRSRCARWPAE
ncbi:plasmid pRiA4b ORF-3 family protein [Burkholderia seminalis]|uniref:plasmid pRiA4b ORF-3 family protein n=1 Tax=Burkholderia seminalis TaxID=488731 RepID=UPI001CF3AB47|nr:plasmid pRiA4b ORF-3 family protein [Burkholderia seminalis]